MDEAALGTTVTCTDDINKRSRDDCSDDTSKDLQTIIFKVFPNKRKHLQTYMPRLNAV